MNVTSSVERGTHGSIVLLLLTSGFLISGSGWFSLRSSVKIKGVMLKSDWLDQTLLLELPNEGTGNGSSNLELLTQYGSGDAQDLWDLLDHSLELSLLEEDSVVKLLLNLNLGP